MSIPTDSNRDLLTVVATVRAKAGKQDELRSLIETIVAPSRAEEGCVTYALHQGASDPTVFVFYENWVSQAHLDAHLASPHMTAPDFNARFAELIDGGVEITPLRRVA